MNWDDYAASHPMRERDYWYQADRVDAVVAVVLGSVLDVGAADGYITERIAQAGHPVHAVDISPARVQRIRASGFSADVGDATDLDFVAGAFTTVVVGEILEHLPNPGVALAEACRVAAERVVVTLPLDGWNDPTHLWDIDVEICQTTYDDPDKQRQAVITFTRR